MKILVTGGSGFLGHVILERLHNTHPEWTLINLDIRPPLEPQDYSTYIEADITSLSSLTTIMLDTRPDLIVHTAGIVPSRQQRYMPSARTSALVDAVNVTGTANVLTAARHAAVAKLVYTSSCTVIADHVGHDYPHMTEDLPYPPPEEMLLYGRSKAEAERLVLSANANANANDDESGNKNDDDDPDSDGGVGKGQSGPPIQTCALRPATIIGPGEPLGIIDMIVSILDTPMQSSFVLGDGHALFDFVHVSNVAHAHVLAVERMLDPNPTVVGQVAGRAFFVSNCQPVYFRDVMLEVWARCAGHVPRFEVSVPVGLAWWLGWTSEWIAWFGGRQVVLSTGSVMDAIATRYADCSRARKVLGYEPVIGIVDAVREACDDYMTRTMAAAEKEGKKDR